MKKLISLILILCMACMLVPAMADAAVTGDWYLKTMKMGDTEYDAAAMGYSMAMTLNEDGSVVMNVPSSGESTGTWTLDGENITVDIDGMPASGPVAEDSITLEADGQVMVFTREAPVAITVADVKAAEAAEDFYGSYTAAYIDMAGSMMDVAAMGYPTGVTITAEAFDVNPASEEDMFALTLGMMALTPADMEDGALKMTSATNPEGIDAKLEMLEDGMVKLTVENKESQEAMIFYFAPVPAV